MVFHTHSFHVRILLQLRSADETSPALIGSCAKFVPQDLARGLPWFRSDRCEQDLLMPAFGEFPGLSAEERQSLAAWRIPAAERGIETVIDLTARRWNVQGTRTILGVFQREAVRAAWLLVQEDTGWSLIDCELQTIVGGTLSLDDALALVIA
jgi:hypothetical protein